MAKKGQNKDISIVFLSYNQEDTVEKALLSILEQKTTYSYEIIAVDDASTDRTQEIILKYKEQYPDIIVPAFHSKNQGTSRAAMANSPVVVEGRYIAYLEADDYWCHPDKLQKQVDFLENNPEFVGASHGYRTLFLDQSAPDRDYVPPTDVWSIEDNREFYTHTATWVRRNIFKRVAPPQMQEERFFGDVVMHYCYAPYGKMKYFPEIMSVYRYTGQGEWSSLDKKLQDYRNVVVYKTLDELLEYKYHSFFRRRYWMARTYYFFKYHTVLRWLIFFPLRWAWHLTKPYLIPLKEKIRNTMKK